MADRAATFIVAGADAAPVQQLKKQLEEGTDERKVEAMKQVRALVERSCDRSRAWGSFF